MEVEGVDWPSVSGCNRENSPNRGEASDGRKCVEVIDALDLCESFGNEPCFVALNLAVSILLEVQYPFAFHHISPPRPLDQFPSPCLL